MACNFSFAAKKSERNKMAVFLSDTGDEYRVNYEVTEFRDILLTVEWALMKQVVVMVELLTEDFRCISSKGCIGRGTQTHLKICDAFKSDDVTECSVLLVISVIPYVELKDQRDHTEVKKETLKRSLKVDYYLDETSHLMQDMFIGLAMDMHNLATRGDMSDAVLTNGNISLKVHSVILAARSPIFNEMLRSSLKEKNIIACASDEALQGMVKFIYSGFVKMKDIKLAEELYVLADKYEIQDLFEMCSKYMSNFALGRVLDTVVLADKYSDEFLKNSAISYIIKNLPEMQADEKWLVFAKENVELAAEILNLANDVPEKGTLHAFMLGLSSKSEKI